MIELKYRNTPIYSRVWEKGKSRGKSGFVVNRGFDCLHILGPILGKGNDRGKSGYYCSTI